MSFLGSIGNAIVDEPGGFMQGLNMGSNFVGNLYKQRMYEKYAPKEEQAKLADMIARQQNDQAMAQYAPELYKSRAGLAALQAQEQPQLFNAQIASMGQQSQMRALQEQILKQKLGGLGTYTPKSNFGKLTQDYQNIINTYGADSPQAKSMMAYMNKLQQSNNGITVGMDANGNPLVQVGGSGSGGFGSAGAKTMRDPVTGQLYTVPTTAVATKMQNALSTDSQLMDSINKSVDLLSPYTGFKGKAKLAIGGLENKLGGNNLGVSDYNYATQFLIPMSSENLLRQAGINATGENVARMQHALTFGSDESPEGMKQRAFQTLKYLQQVQQRNQQMLSPGGIPLNQTPAESASSSGQRKRFNPETGKVESY